MADDATPTQRLNTATTTVSVAPPRTNPLLVGLLIVGSLLVVGVVVIIVLLVNRGDSAAVAGATPSPTATESSSPTSSPSDASAPPPAPSGPPAQFTSFIPFDTEVQCARNSSDLDPIIDVSWQSMHAVSAWIWINADDAVGTVEIPVRGDKNDLPLDFRYPCFAEQTNFVITLVGEDGGHVSQKWLIYNTGDHD